MAGSDARFNAAQFRESIKFAMRMGLPTETSERPTFRWIPERTYSTPDSAGFPLDWNDTPTSSVAPTDFRCDCVVEFASATAINVTTGTGLGQFDVTRGVLTILDEDWADVLEHGDRIPDQVVIDGNTYVVKFVGPPLGLFEVTIYQVNIEALDES